MPRLKHNATKSQCTAIFPFVDPTYQVDLVSCVGGFVVAGSVGVKKSLFGLIVAPHHFFIVMINSLSRRGTSTAASRPTHPCVSSSRSASPNSSQHSIYCCPAEPLSLACSHTFAPAGCSTSSSSRSRSRSIVIARAANTADDDWDGYAADNFYQILGVPENASRRDIKRAYKAMMKDFHPDLSGDEESTEFCILLNDIYEASRGMCGIGWQPRCSPCRSWAFSSCSHTTSIYTGLTGPSAVASCAPSLLTQLFWSGFGRVDKRAFCGTSICPASTP